MAHPSNPPLSSGVVLFTQGDTSYEFFRDLGAGRLGERVLLAFVRTPQGLGDCVVLKCIPRPQGEELPEGFPLTRTRLEEEVRLARHLQHPRIARVHGLVEMPHGLCVVMENLEGLSLNTLLSVAQARGRYFSESFVLYVGAEVAAALDYAHTRTDEAGTPLGIVNRDVNPGRIRLGPRGEVRMTDFGVALSRLTGRVATSFPRPQGEVLYAAPEALMGDAVDARADLFSLGLTLLEFATGRHLYDPSHLLAEAVKARLSREEREKVLVASVASLGLKLPPFAEDIIRCAMSYRPVDVERAAEGLSVPLRDILHTLLRPEPSERFATASELEGLLRSRLAQLPPYSGENALREVQQALAESENQLWDLEVPDDEGGIAVPMLDTPHPDEIPTTPASRSGSRKLALKKRHPDDVTTVPGPGARRTGSRQPA
ncbi:serine/threonine-protein kinase [Corallococcus exiguus]|uniref:non-specific serine/threonine protein kinase n=1 Tax=Corallococcus exiguus TaxID=83462 RepID=A0A7X5BSY6_9BACT|nr:serine/threonine-protein kinase [Corallococcus exiguus]NBC44791.1 protein kinase [Corallococcus exiguus]TNV59235.1 serine/threonine protein kinase [Corallococcus exiguus]